MLGRHPARLSAFPLHEVSLANIGRNPDVASPRPGFPGGVGKPTISEGVCVPDVLGVADARTGVIHPVQPLALLAQPLGDEITHRSAH